MSSWILHLTYGDHRTVTPFEIGVLTNNLIWVITQYEHTYRYSTAIMHKIITDTPLQKSSEELVDLQSATSTFLKSINSTMVDFFPQLALLPRPLQCWRNSWKEVGMSHYRVFKHFWDGWADVTSPHATPSFLRDEVLRTYPGSDMQDQAMYYTMSALAAGADNPRMTFNSLLMACLLYPEATRKARAELDALCGLERLPLLSDLPGLPYVSAMAKEVLRWRPTVPLMPQRVLVKDMEFEGYRFPRGTEFLVNTVAVCRNGHEHPDAFLPDRWLVKSGSQPPAVPQDLWQFAFSAGRRSCVGYKVAQKELFLGLARILHCLEITSRRDFDPTKVDPFSVGEPFPLKITVRSKAHERLILEHEEASSVWGGRGDEGTSV